MTEAETVAIIGLIGACIVAVPGILAWRSATRNTRKAEEAARAAAESARITTQVKAALDELRPVLDGRLTELLEMSRARGETASRAARAKGHAAGIEAEQARMRPADQIEPAGAA